MRFVFLDTCISLHYPPLKDLGWLGICEAEAVTILVCNPVVAELDEKKSDALFSERARRRIKEIEDNIQKQIRPNVWVDYFSDDELAAQWSNRSDPPPNDERTAQCALNYQTTNNADVAVITEDLGMKLRCRTHGIRIFSPPDHLRLQNPASEEQQKIRKLEEKVRDLANRHPDLKLIVTPASGELKRPKPWNVDEQLSHASEALRRKRPDVFHRAFEPKLNDFMARVRDWIEYQNALADESGRTVVLNALLRNDGRAPAKNVDVTIEFPKSISAICHDHARWGTRVEQRSPPRNSLFPIKCPAREPVPNWLWNLYPRMINTYQLQERKLICQYELIRQSDEVAIPLIYATFGSWVDAQRCPLEVRIRILEPPDEHRFIVPVQLTTSDMGAEPPEIG